MSSYEYTKEEIEKAFDDANGYCECCGKLLSWKNQGRYSGRGSWEAHHGNRFTPVILCTGEPENCHLYCGHNGDYYNQGVTPRIHKGG